MARRAAGRKDGALIATTGERAVRDATTEPGGNELPERLGIRMFGALSLETAHGVLGPGDLGGVRPKQVLEILVAARGRLVPTDRIAELLWDEPRPGAAASIQTFVSVLRRHLTDELLVDAADHDLGLRRGGHLDALRHLVDHRVREAERQVQLVALRLGAETHADQRELSVIVLRSSMMRKRSRIV